MSLQNDDVCELETHPAVVLLCETAQAAWPAGDLAAAQSLEEDLKRSGEACLPRSISSQHLRNLTLSVPTMIDAALRSQLPFCS